MAAPSVSCIFFQRGNCRNGAACRFSHALAQSSDSEPQSDPRSQVLCKFYLQGNCNKGKNCPYRHDEQPLPSSSAQSQTNHDNDTFVRVFRGALVRYGDGACVASLRLASEYSSVRLDGLADKTTAADVISLLEDLGHDVEVDGLRIVTLPQSATCSAYISTPDFEFSKTLSTSLIDGGYRNLKAVPVPPRLPSWASTRRVRCNKLKLKWSAPHRYCHLYFTKWTTAQRVAGKFNSGRYRIGNTRVKCDVSYDGELPHAILSRLPYHAFEELVRAFITADYDTPLAVIMDKEPIWDEESTVSSIKEMLTDVGPLDFMAEPNEHDGGSYWTAFASFENDYDAQAAARVIEKDSHNLPHELDLTARLLYNATFKVSSEVYHHVRNRLEDCLDKLDAPQLHVTHRATGAILSLDSVSSKEIAECANVIETIVAGDVIKSRNGVGPFWVSELAHNGPASKSLKEIQKRHGVLLLPNRSKREVRFFGEASKQAAVQEDVAQSLTKDSQRVHTIDLNEDGFSWLCKTGLDLLKNVVGDKILSLNITSTPKKLVVAGSDEEYCEVLALLETSRISFAVMEAKSRDDCSVCFTPPDSDPVVLRCGHSYCKDCFEGLCKNASTARDLSVACAGAEDKCRATIALDEIQAHVDSSTLEDLLESSFSTYITRRPNEFHYCPTPECGYIYRPAKASTHSLSHMCPKCLQRICRSCHANHDGQSCGTYRANQAFDVYKRENQTNVKDCPKCQTTVEKIDGCNHMQCGGCKVHLCWVCLLTFEESPECYRHMTEAHGGIGLEE